MVEKYVRNPNILCNICGKPIYRRPSDISKSHGRAFCSNVCYSKSLRKEIPCKVCGKLILSGLNKRTCSRACANKLRIGTSYKHGQLHDKVKAYSIIRSRLFNERGKFCESCGERRVEILVMHHIDTNRQNNDFSNLMVLCPNCHAETHCLLRKKRLGFGRGAGAVDQDSLENYCTSNGTVGSNPTLSAS